MFHPFHISSAFSQCYSAAQCLLHGRGSTARRGVSSIHSFINHLSMRRPCPISQLRPPDTPGLIKKARDNGITGQINDPLMKSLTKQAKTARPTYVFHHAVALAFPLAQPPLQAQLGRGRHREREAEWEKKERKMTLCSDTAKPPTQGPFQTFGWTKASVAILCRSDPPSHTDSSWVRSFAGAKKGSTEPYAAEAAHLVAQPIVRPIPGASPSIFVSLGQTETERERETLYDGVRERGTRLQLQDE